MTGTPPGAAAPDGLRREVEAWRNGRLRPQQALSLFDALPPVEPDEMIGLWRGSELATGHPLDGLLGALGWYGKAFHGPDRVDPLLFRARGGRIVPLDPALMPLRLALALPRLARSAPVRAGLALVLPLLIARRSGARLRHGTWRGVRSAAMPYDRKPVVDHFRRAGPALVLGAMEARGMDAPYFFLLDRIETGSARGGAAAQS